jgi:predicted RNase H-like HicB family nuclease
MSEIEYRFTVRPLTEDEGGGYLIEFPDLPGCMSDGETIEEAIANGEDAQRGWMAAMKEAGRPIPPPSSNRLKAIAANGSCAPLNRYIAGWPNAPSAKG